MKEIVKHEESAITLHQDELSVADMITQVKKIQEIQKQVMKEDEHYGIIPGTKKPSLLKAGAEKLCLAFRLDPQYESSEVYDGNHLTVKSKCTLYHITTGRRLGSGEGSCSTKESKYAYRDSRRVCPKCQKETIIEGKKEYGGGWLCFAKRGGCGAKFKTDDPTITMQTIGRTANEDVADQYNTVLKMANKRSLVAAVLNVTAASDIFTQDLEDMARKEAQYEIIKDEEPKAADTKKEPSVIDEMFPPGKEKPEVPLFDILDSELSDLARLGDPQKIEVWGMTNAQRIKELSVKEQDVLRKAYKKALTAAKKQTVTA